MKELACRVGRGMAVGLLSGITCSVLGVDLSSPFLPHVGLGQMAVGGAIIGGSIVAANESVDVISDKLRLEFERWDRRDFSVPA